MASIFSRIVAGEIPCYKVAETEDCLAFLDVSPIVYGHVLVIPKKEVDYIFDIDDELFVKLHLFSKKVAKALKKVVPCVKIGVAVVGVDVPHAHIHLAPINKGSELAFDKERVNLTPEEFKELAAKISAAME
jgi:histidine triad (HIT) family protein